MMLKKSAQITPQEGRAKGWFQQPGTPTGYLGGLVHWLETLSLEGGGALGLSKHSGAAQTNGMNEAIMGGGEEFCKPQNPQRVYGKP